MNPLEPITAVSGWTLDWHISWWGVLGLVVYALALLSIPSVLLQRQGRPQAALSWVLILFLVPLVGLIAWWALGRKHLHRRKRKRRRAAARITQRISQVQAAAPDPPQAQWSLLPIDHLPPEIGEWVFPPTSDNEAELLVDGAETFPAMERMIREAQEFIHVIFYIWQPDETGRFFRDLLAEKARQGVPVRLLLDAVGAAPGLGRFMNPLRAAGGEVAAFLPPLLLKRKLDWNFRNHRKLLLVDGREAVIGGMNIGDEYRGAWRDTTIRFAGPVVDQLQEVFAEDWYFATGDDFVEPSHFGRWSETPPPEQKADCGLVASGPHSDVNLTHEAFSIAISSARQRIWLTTPYFIPDQVILSVLRTAVFRGVDVQLLLPERGDHLLVDLACRSYYPELLQAGVRIFEYGDGVLHSKTAVFDQDVSFVGSANMDIRSFRLNFELSCFVRSRHLADQLVAVFGHDLTSSREITTDALAHKSYFRRLSEATAHLLSPLL